MAYEIVNFVLKYMLNDGIFDPPKNEKPFAIGNTAFQYFCCLVFLLAHLYLFRMGLTLLKLMEDAGYGYMKPGKIAITVILILDLLDHVRMLLMPVVYMFIVFDTDFVCSEHLTKYLQVAHVFHEQFDPLMYQVLFLLIIWKFSEL